MSARKRVQVIVEGRVQGVFFRAYTREEAIKLGLCGWVRNRADGTVEAMVEGDAAIVDKMLQWFHQGSPHSIVSNIRTSEEDPAGDYDTFEIQY